tara:strand:- start:8607 stop:9254 length:648 start_codon:yes stop_codon:yes gene_type:complete
MIFNQQIDDFGVVLKGESLARISEIVNNFNHCFIVNNNNLEYKKFGEFLKNKDIVHFVNRSKTAPLKRKYYRELQIKNIQFNKAEIDEEIVKVKLIYESYGLNCHLLPEELLEYNNYFQGKGNYERKYPNTGVLSIIYAAHIIKPKRIWIIGLDFYQSDYLFRRRWNNPLKGQREKMERLDILGQFIELVKLNQDIQFNMITKANLPKVDNLNIL